MNMLALYALFVFLVALLGLVVSYNYLRYRFAGDRTLAFLTLYVIVFLIDVIATLSVLHYESLSFFL